MKLKQIISAALITALFLSATGTAAFGAENSNEGLPEVGTSEVEITESGGIIHFDYGNDDSVLLKSDDKNRGLLMASADSSSYNTDLSNLKYVTEPKNQGSLGVCWAFPQPLVLRLCL